MEEIKEVMTTNGEEVTMPEALNAITRNPEEFAPEVGVGEDSESAKAFKVLDLYSQMRDLKDMRNDIVEQQLKVIDDDSMLNALKLKVESMTIEEIKDLTKEKIEEIYSFNGEPIHIGDPEEMGEDRYFEFRRDFLIFEKESITALQQIDDALAQMEAEAAKDQEEFDRIVAEYGNVSNLIRNKLIKDSEEASTPELREKYQTMLFNFDDAFNLEQLYNHYSKFNTANTIYDYKDDKKAESLYKKYMKALRKLKLRADLTAFNNLELKFLPEKYHKYPNLFLFAVIKMYAYKHETVQRSTDGIFLSQFGVNIQNLFKDRFETPEQKHQFIENIQRVLDLFYK